MKTLLLLFIILPILVFGQNKNYTKTTTYSIDTFNSIATPQANQANVTVEYLDGLGRPIQQIGVNYSTNKNIVKHREYDQYGQESTDYLPFTTDGSSLNFVEQAKTLVLNYPPYLNDNPVSKIVTEASPLNRPIEISSSGNSWSLENINKNTIKTEYLSNIHNEVKNYSAIADASTLSEKGYYNITLIGNGSYNHGRGTLIKTITKNENWKPTNGKNNTIEEFKNSEGKVILIRTYSDIVHSDGNISVQVAHDTYYIYDQFGNLVYVVPPNVSNVNQLETHCYQYRYDYRNRLVEKKVPDQRWQYIVYDKLNRPVAIGPTFAPFENLTTEGWIIKKYDELNRPILTGWYAADASSTGRKLLQSQYNSSAVISENKIQTTSNSNVNGVNFRYTNMSFPTVAYHILTVAYFDDYNFPDAPTNFNNPDGQPYYYNNSRKPRGLATGSYTRVLENTTTYNYESSFTMYDSKSRAVFTKNRNYHGGYTESFAKTDGLKLLSSTIKHKYKNTTPEVIITEEFTYTDQNRLSSRSHKINDNDPFLMSRLIYDDLGRISVKEVGGLVDAAQPFQKIDYEYNIKGWLTNINNVNNLAMPNDPKDLFAYKINYDTVEAIPGYSGRPLYNGGISEVFWRTASDNVLRKYGYYYDTKDRLVNAIYQKPESAVKLTNSYNESVVYDKNGNIKSLKRTGAFDDAIATLEIDDLTYTYNPEKVNQLTNISDGSNSSEGFINDSASTTVYTFDENGNMKSDLSKNITHIKYNHLNLPTKITFSNGGSIDYIYNAYGSQIKQSISASHIQRSTEYMNGFQYSNGVLNFFSTSEGYVQNTVSNGLNNFNYVYNYSDHLGNVRLSYGEDPLTHTVKILKENNYYPFGLKHKNYNMSEKFYNKTHGGVGIVSCPTCPKTYQYQYNGKEYQSDLDLNVTQMDFRQYDNATGRFNTVDALSEATYSNSPYHFANNNPIYFSDPTGLISKAMEKAWIENSIGEVTVWQNDGNDNFDMVSGGGDSGGFVNAAGVFHSGDFTAFENLSNVTLRGDFRTFLLQIQNHVYTYSPFYSHFSKQNLSNIKNGITVADGLFNIMGNLAQMNDFWLGKNGKFNDISWKTGNGSTGGPGGAFKAASHFKYGGYVMIAMSGVTGGVEIYRGSQKDAGFGYNAQKATASTIGGLGGGAAGAVLGAEIGASIGVFFGGVGIIPGTLLGGVIGSAAGSYYGGEWGSTAGESAVDLLHGR